MKCITVLSFSVVLGLALLQSCELFFGSTTTTTTTLESVQLTSSALVGTWTDDYVSSLTSNDVTYPLSITLTLSFASDGTYMSSRSTYKQQNPSESFVPYEFRGEKGTYTFTDDSLTYAPSARRSGAAPFSDIESGWVLVGTPESSADTAIIARGILHTRSVYKAEGTTSGLVGVWTRLRFSTPDEIFQKNVYTFRADGSADLSDYISFISTFPLEPVNPPTTFSYSTVDNQVTFTFSAAQDTVHFAIFGSYLVLGGASGLGGWTKIE